jgi:hypothetical protein
LTILRKRRPKLQWPQQSSSGFQEAKKVLPSDIPTTRKIRKLDKSCQDSRKRTGKTKIGKEATEVIDTTEMIVMIETTGMIGTEDQEIEITPPTFRGKRSPIVMISSMHQPNTTINSPSYHSKLLPYRTSKSNY